MPGKQQKEKMNKRVSEIRTCLRNVGCRDDSLELGLAQLLKKKPTVLVKRLSNNEIQNVHKRSTLHHSYCKKDIRTGGLLRNNHTKEPSSSFGVSSLSRPPLRSSVGSSSHESAKAETSTERSSSQVSERTDSHSEIKPFSSRLAEPSTPFGTGSHYHNSATNNSLLNRRVSERFGHDSPQGTSSVPDDEDVKPAMTESVHNIVRPSSVVVKPTLRPRECIVLPVSVSFPLHVKSGSKRLTKMHTPDAQEVAVPCAKADMKDLLSFSLGNPLPRLQVETNTDPCVGTTGEECENSEVACLTKIEVLDPSDDVKMLLNNMPKMLMDDFEYVSHLLIVCIKDFAMFDKRLQEAKALNVHADVLQLILDENKSSRDAKFEKMAVKYQLLQEYFETKIFLALEWKVRSMCQDIDHDMFMNIGKEFAFYRCVTLADRRKKEQNALSQVQGFLPEICVKSENAATHKLPPPVEASSSADVADCLITSTEEQSSEKPKETNSPNVDNQTEAQPTQSEPKNQSGNDVPSQSGTPYIDQSECENDINSIHGIQPKEHAETSESQNKVSSLSKTLHVEQSQSGSDSEISGVGVTSEENQSQKEFSDFQDEMFSMPGTLNKELAEEEICTFQDEISSLPDSSQKSLAHFSLGSLYKKHAQKDMSELKKEISSLLESLDIELSKNEADSEILSICSSLEKGEPKKETSETSPKAQVQKEISVFTDELLSKTAISQVAESEKETSQPQGEVPPLTVTPLEDLRQEEIQNDVPPLLETHPKTQVHEEPSTSQGILPLVGSPEKEQSQEETLESQNEMSGPSHIVQEETSSQDEIPLLPECSQREEFPEETIGSQNKMSSTNGTVQDQKEITLSSNEMPSIPGISPQIMSSKQSLELENKKLSQLNDSPQEHSQKLICKSSDKLPAQRRSPRRKGDPQYEFLSLLDPPPKGKSKKDTIKSPKKVPPTPRTPKQKQSRKQILKPKEQQIVELKNEILSHPDLSLICKLENNSPSKHRSPTQKQTSKSPPMESRTGHKRQRQIKSQKRSKSTSSPQCEKKVRTCSSQLKETSQGQLEEQFESKASCESEKESLQSELEMQAQVTELEGEHEIQDSELLKKVEIEHMKDAQDTVTEEVSEKNSESSSILQEQALIEECFTQKAISVDEQSLVEMENLSLFQNEDQDETCLESQDSLGMESIETEPQNQNCYPPQVQDHCVVPNEVPVQLASEAQIQATSAPQNQEWAMRMQPANQLQTQGVPCLQGLTPIQVIPQQQPQAQMNVVSQLPNMPHIQFVTVNRSQGHPQILPPHTIVPQVQPQIQFQQQSQFFTQLPNQSVVHVLRTPSQVSTISQPQGPSQSVTVTGGQLPVHFQAPGQLHNAVQLGGEHKGMYFMPLLTLISPQENIEAHMQVHRAAQAQLEAQVQLRRQ